MRAAAAVEGWLFKVRATGQIFLPDGAYDFLEKSFPYSSFACLLSYFVFSAASERLPGNYCWARSNTHARDRTRRHAGRQSPEREPHHLHDAGKSQL
jgi:hypothetical protein